MTMKLQIILILFSIFPIKYPEFTRILKIKNLLIADLINQKSNTENQLEY